MSDDLNHDKENIAAIPNSTIEMVMQFLDGSPSGLIA